MQKPLSKSNVLVPVMKPRLPSLAQISPFFQRIDFNQNYSNGGPLVRELESGYSTIFNVEPEKVIAVSNATIGITVATLVLDPQTWVLPDFTFSATALGVLNANKDVILADVDKYSWTLQPPQSPSDKNFGYLPVMPFGNNETLMNWKSIKNVIFDLAASVGDSNLKLDWLNEKQIAIFSLHATKISGCGEGGLVICGSPEIAQEIRSRINFGFSVGRKTESIGLNGKMSEYSAAVALASLVQRNEDLLLWSKKNQIAYSESLLRNFSNPNLRQKSVSPYWIVNFDDNLAATFVEFAKQYNIESRKWWPIQISKMPFAIKTPRVTCRINPIAQAVALSHVGLPMWKDIPTNTLEYILKVIDLFNET